MSGTVHEGFFYFDTRSVFLQRRPDLVRGVLARDGRPRDDRDPRVADDELLLRPPRPLLVRRARLRARGAPPPPPRRQRRRRRLLLRRRDGIHAALPGCALRALACRRRHAHERRLAGALLLGMSRSIIHHQKCSSIISLI